MPVVVVRIDDRLVHGQIVQGWLKNINIDRIVVASDAVAKDPMQQMLMSMAMPGSTKLEVKSVEKVAAAAVKGEYEKDKTMILAASPKDVLKMLEQGADFKSVNVGGMHFIPGKRQLLCNMSVDNDDISSLHAIYSKGIEIEGRVLPLDERANIIPIIEKEYEQNCKGSK